MKAVQPATDAHHVIPAAYGELVEVSADTSGTRSGLHRALQRVWQMRKTSVTILIVTLAAGVIIYGGGTIYLGGAPLFHHIDAALGTSVFMEIHYQLMFLLSREGNGEEDAFTKVYQDFDKVLKETSE